MNYHKYEIGPYQLHTIKTKKFKNVIIRVCFKRKITKEEITIRNALSGIMIESTEKYPTERLMAIATEELYDLYYRSNSMVSGKYGIVRFDITFLNEKYSEKGILEQAISFLSEIIFHPNVKDNAFSKDKFERIYHEIEDNLKSLAENPMRYAKIRMLEELDKDLPIAFRDDGYLEDLYQINEQKLYEYYLSMLHHDLVDIFVIGDVDSDEVKNLIGTYFPIKTVKQKSESHYIEHTKFRKRAKVVVEEKDLRQSKLVMGYKAKKLTDFENNYVSVIYSYILGGGTDSKLFKNIREKHSLCYSISSSFYHISNLLVISAGINQEQYKKALRLIKKEVKKMEQGDFSLKDIENAKIAYRAGCKELEDSSLQMINTYTSMEYLKIDSLEERRKKIEKVTKEDVIAFAKKMSFDTVFLLKGVKDHEENSISES